MLTRAGWALVAASAGLVLAGRVFGVTELFVAGAIGVLLPFAALVAVRTTGLRLRVRRTLKPARVHAGDTTRIELAVANSGTRRTPTLTLTDPVDGTRGAALSLAPLQSGASARAAYRLPTTRRGIVHVGPLRVTLEDPFGLCRRRAIAAPVLELTVLPQVHRLRLPLVGGDRDPHGVAVRVNEASTRGDDLLGLRPYVVGDDLRSVHWKASARTGDLIVRQVEQPNQDHTTVVLDTRRTSHTMESFERAVSAVASVASAAFAARHMLRFVAADGTDMGVGTGLSHVDQILEYLATVSPTGQGSLRSTFEVLGRARRGGLVVVGLGRPTAFEVDSLGRLARTGCTPVAIICEEPVPRQTPPGVVVVDFVDRPLTDAWDEAFIRSRRRSFA
jgi:uncharacterized protein (DUF58 family)